MMLHISNSGGLSKKIAAASRRHYDLIIIISKKAKTHRFDASKIGWRGDDTALSSEGEIEASY